MRCIAVSVLCLGIMLAFVAPAYAENLDEADIRKIYAVFVADIRDPEKSLSHMRERLTDDFKLSTKSTQFIGGAAPVESSDSLNKSQMLEATDAGYKSMAIDKYKYDVVSIQLVKDKNIAYVSSTASNSGAIKLPIGNGRFMSAFYDQGQGCVDTVKLVESILKIAQSECLTRISVRK